MSNKTEIDFKVVLSELLLDLQIEIKECNEIKQDGFGLTEIGKGRLEMAEEILKKLLEVTL